MIEIQFQITNEIIRDSKVLFKCQRTCSTEVDELIEKESERIFNSNLLSGKDKLVIYVIDEANRSVKVVKYQLNVTTKKREIEE